MGMLRAAFFSLPQANLLTGAVNLSMRTIHQGPLVGLSVISIYMLVVCLVAVSVPTIVREVAARAVARTPKKSKKNI
jgi:hypothetical protein